MSGCELCVSPGGAVLWSNTACRVVRVEDSAYPGFCRVIWNGHVKEMTDLLPEEREMLMKVVFVVESAVRECYRPEKINLASFGNVTPHVHWHVIPRWSDDKHFPEPIWGSVRRESTAQRPLVDDAILAAALKQGLAAAGVKP